MSSPSSPQRPQQQRQSSSTSIHNKSSREAAAATTAAPHNNHNHELSFNARSVGYLGIALSSLINLSSVSNLKLDHDNNNNKLYGNPDVGVAFGAVTFGVSLILLILDRTMTSWNYTAQSFNPGIFLLERMLRDDLILKTRKQTSAV